MALSGCLSESYGSYQDHMLERIAYLEIQHDGLFENITVEGSREGKRLAKAFVDVVWTYQGNNKGGPDLRALRADQQTMMVWATAAENQTLRLPRDGSDRIVTRIAVPLTGEDADMKLLWTCVGEVYCGDHTYGTPLTLLREAVDEALS